MDLAVQLLAVFGVALGLLLIAILLYLVIRTYILEKCCPSCTRSDDTSASPTVVIEEPPRCTCHDLRLSGLVRRVEDGDGFLFDPRCPQHPMRDSLKVRLAGIDAPEMPNQAKGWPGQPFAQEATDHLTSLIHDKRIDVDLYRKEQYGRDLAFAYVPQNGSPPVNVNIEMVRLGFADLYEGRDCCYGDHEQALRELKEEARRTRAGFWSRIDDPNFETPREYKRRMRALHNPKPAHQRPNRPRPEQAFSQGRRSQKHCIIS